MTTSPYDNLPLNKSDNRKQLEYIDVELEEAADTAADTNVDTDAGTIADTTAGITSDTAADPAPLPIQQPRPAAVSGNTAPHQKTPFKTTPFEHPPKYSQQTLNSFHGMHEYIMPFEESLLVPDIMPDISKILFAEGRAGLDSPEKTSYQKNDFLSGSITVFTVYQPAGDTDCPLDSVRSSISFRTDKCWGDSSCDQFRAEAAVRSITAEMVNERKFIVRGELRIIITEICRNDLRILENSGDDSLMIKQIPVKAAALDFETVETTEISQEITLREGQPSPAKILEESIRITENHRQITSGKLVINASIHYSTLYLGEDDGHPAAEALTGRTDFTQFIPVKDDTDIDHLKTSYDTGDLKMTIADQDHLLLEGNITTQIQGFRNCEFSAATDAYHKIRDIHFDIASQPVTSLISVVSGEISAREVISMDDDKPKPETLLCGHGSISDIKGLPEKGRIVIDSTLPVKLLALDENRRPFIIETSVPLRGTLELPDAEKGMTVCTFAYIKDFWFDKINSRQLEVNVSVTVNIWLCSSESFSTLENLSFAEGTAPARRVPMAVYVVSRGDTLWDVAKRYRCDTETLAHFNQLDPEKPLPAGMKLFVMK